MRFPPQSRILPHREGGFSARWRGLGRCWGRRRGAGAGGGGHQIHVTRTLPGSPGTPGGGREKPHRTSHHPEHHPTIPSTAQPLQAPPDHRQQRSPRCLQHPNAAHNGPPTPTTAHRRSQRPTDAHNEPTMLRSEQTRHPPAARAHQAAARERQAAAARSHTGPPTIQGITRPSQAPPNPYKHHQTIDSSAPRDAFNTPAPPTTAHRRSQRTHDALNEPTMPRSEQTRHPPAARAHQAAAARSHTGPPAIQGITRPSQAPPNRYEHHQTIDSSAPRDAFNTPAPPTTAQRRSQRRNDAHNEPTMPRSSQTRPPPARRERQAAAARSHTGPPTIQSITRPSQAPPNPYKHHQTIDSSAPRDAFNTPAPPTTTHRRSQRRNNAHNDPTMPKSSQTRHPPAARAHQAAARERQAAAARSHTGPPTIQSITRPSQAPPNRYEHHQTIDSSAPRDAFNTPAPPTTAQRRSQRRNDAHNEPTMPRSSQTRPPPARREPQRPTRVTRGTRTASPSKQGAPGGSG